MGIFSEIFGKEKSIEKQPDLCKHGNFMGNCEVCQMTEEAALDEAVLLKGIAPERSKSKFDGRPATIPSSAYSKAENYADFLKTKAKSGDEEMSGAANSRLEYLNELGQKKMDGQVKEDDEKSN